MSAEAKKAGWRLMYEAAHTGRGHLGTGAPGALHCQPHLHQQTKVITRDVRVGTSDNLPLLQPLLAYRPQDPERLHCVLRVEDVVDDALEVEGVVGVGHQLGGVGAGHVEGVGELLVVLAVAEHLEQAVLVPDVFELVVLRAHATSLNVLDGSRLRHTVEI